MKDWEEEAECLDMVYISCDIGMFFEGQVGVGLMFRSRMASGLSGKRHRMWQVPIDPGGNSSQIRQAI